MSQLEFCGVPVPCGLSTRAEFDRIALPENV